MKRTLGITLLLTTVTAGCSTAPQPHKDPIADTVRYTIHRVEQKNQNKVTPAYQVEVLFQEKGRTLNAPRLLILPEQWASIFVGQTASGVISAPHSKEGEEPKLKEAQIWTDATFVTVRCAEAKDGKISAKLRAVQIQNSKIVWSRTVDAILASGEERKF